MTKPSDLLQAENLSRQRLIAFLELLAQQGRTQQQVASTANLPAQYLSDMKHSRRPVTELVARRLGDAFDVNYEWLLGKSNSMESSAGSRPGHSASSADSDSNRLPAWLPVLFFPIEGDPRANPAWDGTRFEISGSAADKLLFAKLPYVLRFGHDDRRGRLRQNDLVLISQSPSPDAEISVIRQHTKLFLARRINESWERVAPVAKEKKLPSDCPIAGHCMGIIWGSLAIPQED